MIRSKKKYFQKNIRLYTLEKGNIKINGYNIADIPISQLRKKIAYIPQNVFLFQGSIIENIKMGDSSIEDKDVISFFQRTPIGEFIKCFPAGYYTILTEKGENISGGQKQIIALARVLFRKADILSLDEATSAMDINTRKALEQIMQSIENDFTIIIITHQLDIAKLCNNIYMIEKRKAIKFG